MNIHPMTWVGLAISKPLTEQELLVKSMSEICQLRGVTEQEVMSKSRLHSLVLSRHEFCYLARKKTNLSLKFIGALIGRDHATVLHSVKVWSDLLDTDSNIRANHMKILRNLNLEI